MDEFLARVKELIRKDLEQAVDCFELKNWSMAIVYLEKAYGRTTLLRDEELKYEILYHLMTVYLYSPSPGRLCRVEECFQEMARLKVVNYTLQTDALRLRGIAFVRRGKFEEGAQVFLQLLQVSRGRGVHQNWAYLSDIYLLQHYFTQKKTLNLAKHYGFRLLDECIQKPFLRKEKVWVLRQLGRIFLLENKFSDALRFFREHLDLLDVPAERYRGFLDLAETFIVLGQHSRGLQYLKEAEGFFRRHGDNASLGQAFCLKGKYLVQEGQIEQGILLFEEALKLFHQTEEWERIYLTLQEIDRGAAKKHEQRLDLYSDLTWLLQSYILKDFYFK